MSQPEKFDFGTVFEGPVEDNPFAGAQEKERLWTEDEVEQEKSAAHAKGLAAGQAETLQAVEQRIAEAVQGLMERSEDMLRQVETVRDGLETEAKRLALAVGTKIGSELLMQMRRMEIEAIVSDALSLLSNQPHVVIRVHEELLDGFRTRFETLSEQRGFAGKLIILGEPDMDRSDCRIEWAEGGIARDAAALGAQIDDIVARHLPAAAPLETPEPAAPDAAAGETTPAAPAQAPDDAPTSMAETATGSHTEETVQ